MRGFFKPGTKLLQDRWNAVLLIMAVAVMIVALLKGGFHSFHNDFSTAFASAQILKSGGPLYEQGSWYVYPPLYAFLITPLTFFSLVTARWIWVIINIPLIGIIAVLAYRTWSFGFKLQATRWQIIGACALTVLLMQDLILHVFRDAQNDLFIVLGFTLAFYWLERKPLTAGLILGLIVMIKYQALLLLPWLILRARWRILLGIAVGIAIGALLPALMVGWHRNLEYLQIALRIPVHIISHPSTDDSMLEFHSIFWLDSLSISNGLARVFQFMGWPIQGAFICVLILAGTIFFFLWKTWQKNGIPFIWRPPLVLDPKQEAVILPLEANLILLCMLIFSPNASWRHFTILFSFNLFAVLMILLPQFSVKRWPLVVAMVVMQLFQLKLAFSFPIPIGQFLGLLGWAYFIFLFVVTKSALASSRGLGQNAMVSFKIHFEGNNMREVSQRDNTV